MNARNPEPPTAMLHLPPTAMLHPRRSTCLALAIFALAAAACAGNQPTEPPPPDGGDRIAMTRGPCFGACPIYTVTVWGDGRVRFEGDRFVEATGTHTSTIDDDDVAALFAFADSIGFFDLPADITPANASACGDGSWTDMPGAEIAITWASRIHTVNHYHGCPAAPARLTDLENRIDAVAGTAAWIGSR